MSIREVNARFKVHRDVAADWTSQNPALLPGEIGFESDTKRMKVGDGVTAWNDLAYLVGSSGAGWIEFPFAWGDASPRPVVVAPAGKLVFAADLHVSQAFDGDTPSLTLGDAGDVDRLMQATQNDPREIATYTVSPNYRYGADTQILLTITPGIGATAGAGLLTLFIEQ